MYPLFRKHFIVGAGTVANCSYYCSSLHEFLVFQIFLMLRCFLIWFSEDELEEHFCKLGNVSQVHLVIDKDTKRSKGIAYVAYTLPECAARYLFLSLASRLACCNLLPLQDQKCLWGTIYVVVFLLSFVPFIEPSTVWSVYLLLIMRTVPYLTFYYCQNMGMFIINKL